MPTTATERCNGLPSMYAFSTRHSCVGLGLCITCSLHARGDITARQAASDGFHRPILQKNNACAAYCAEGVLRQGLWMCRWLKRTSRRPTLCPSGWTTAERSWGQSRRKTGQARSASLRPGCLRRWSRRTASGADPVLQCRACRHGEEGRGVGQACTDNLLSGRTNLVCMSSVPQISDSTKDKRMRLLSSLASILHC